VREFIGHDLFDTLLTENPTRWPWHAWVNFPLVPLTLIASRTPLVLWTTSPLVPLLFSWPSTAPVNAVAVGAARRLAVRPQLWPPPPVLVCALFPSIRALYTRLRERVTHALVSPRTRRNQPRQIPQPPPPPPPPQQPPQQPQQQVQQQGRAQENGGGQQQRFGLQIHELFDFEIRAHIRDQPAGAAAANNHDDAPQDQPQPQPQPPPQVNAAPAPAPAPAPAAPMNDEDFAAAAARTIRITSASFGRLVGGALAMPTIARMMGFALLRLSHVLPLVRVIIAPRERQIPATPAAAAVGLVGLWNNLQRSRLFGGWDNRQERQQRIVIGNGNGTALGGKVLSGLFLTTSQEWAMSDPVWCVQYQFCASCGCSTFCCLRWRNVLGLAVFLVVRIFFISWRFLLVCGMFTGLFVFLGEGRIEDPPFEIGEEGDGESSY
jgi:hypothetical protein